MKSKTDKTAPLSLKANALWNSVGSVFYLGCQWLTTVFVVLLSSGYDNSGVLAFVMGTGVVFSAIGVYGIRPYQVSDIEARYSNSNYIGFRLITNSIGILICILYTLFISGSASMVVTTALYLLFKADECFADVLYGIYQSNYRMDYIGVSQIIRGVVSLSAFSLGLICFDDLNIAIVAMTGSCLLVTMLYDLPHASLFGSVVPHISLHAAYSLAKECFFGMLACTLIGWISTIARQLYGLMDGDASLGIYAALAAPAVLVQVAANYLYSPFLRDLAKSAKKGRVFFLKHFFKILCILIGAVITLIAVVAPLGTVALPVVYGDSIADYVWVFPWVLVATGSLGILYYFYNTLIALRLFVVAILMATIGFAVAIALSAVLIPISGMNGINLAIVGGALVGSLVSFFGIAGYFSK